MAKKSKIQKNQKRSHILYKVALVLISTFIIVWFMPRNDSIRYVYEIDKPWQYGEIIANSPFTIYKTNKEIQEEKERILKDFQPYYDINNSVCSEMHKVLYSKIKKDTLDRYNYRYTYHIRVLLDTIYKKGVLSMVEYNKLQTENSSHIKILDNNTAVSVPITNLFSTKSAYEYIMSADTANFKHSVLQKYDINELIAPNLTFDEKKTNSDREGYLSDIDGAVGSVMSGQRIIDRGEIVTAEKYRILQSYEKAFSKSKDESQESDFSIVGKSVFVLFIMIMLVTYLSIFRDDYFDKYQPCILLFSFPIGFCILAFLMVSHHFLHVFVLPCCMVPIVIRVFLDSRTAFMFHTAMVIIISLVLQNPYEFVILQLLTGMIAIQTMRELSQRSQIIKTAALIALTYIIFYSSYELIIENTFTRANYNVYLYFVVNGIMLLFAYPLLWVIEKSFSFVSDVTLIELSNTSHPLLQKMSEIAPGTLQHSMQVANLSSEVAKKIKARHQLVRTAALYHDIGKLERPVFFTENQKGVSPHKHLSPQKSAEVIIAHVKNGIALAEKHNIPKIIKDFIITHHGDGLVKYFYITYKNEHPDEEVDESLFRYPGPNPSTKEHAILMMADAVEAASRSLNEYTEESISNLVDKIIDSQTQDGFFAECDITFRDIAIAKKVFKEKLQTIYHTRISYPELNKNNEK